MSFVEYHQKNVSRTKVNTLKQEKCQLCSGCVCDKELTKAIPDRKKILFQHDFVIVCFTFATHEFCLNEFKLAAREFADRGLAD